MRFALLALLALLATAACAPRIAIGYDSTAKMTGPLANLMPIARRTAITGEAAAPVPEGRNYSFGLGFGDKSMNVGLRVQGNNITSSTLDNNDGPQYLSAAAALDLRFSFLRWKGLAATGFLAPGRTVLIDSVNGERSWGSGIRYGGAASYSLLGFTVFADFYQEKLVFSDGPATGNSSRSGITLGLAFQP
jgi:hypothetical protein